jgi:hypothetical protein
MSTTKTMTITGLAALALVATLAFTGCTSNSRTATSPVVTATAVTTETPAPVATTPAVVAPAPGATVTTDAEQKAATDAGLLLWDQFDASGNYVSSVVFAKDAPLPETVKAAVASSVSAAHAAVVASGITGSTATAEQATLVAAIQSNAKDKATRIAALSGRKILVVTPIYAAPDGTTYGWAWYAVASASAGYPNHAVQGGFSRDEFVSGLQAWVAAQSDPTSYEIIVAD